MTVIAAVNCPRCPSDTADVDLLTDDFGYVCAVGYWCRVCGCGWVERGRSMETTATPIPTNPRPR